MPAQLLIKVSKFRSIPELYYVPASNASDDGNQPLATLSPVCLPRLFACGHSVLWCATILNLLWRCISFFQVQMMQFSVEKIDVTAESDALFFWCWEILLSVRILVGYHLLHIEHIDSTLGNFSAKIPFGENSDGENSVRRNFRSAKFPFGENSVRRKFRSAKIPSAKFPSAKIPSAKIPSAESCFFKIQRELPGQ